MQEGCRNCRQRVREEAAAAAQHDEDPLGNAEEELRHPAASLAGPVDHPTHAAKAEEVQEHQVLATNSWPLRGAIHFAGQWTGRDHRQGATELLVDAEAVRPEVLHAADHADAAALRGVRAPPDLERVGDLRQGQVPRRQEDEQVWFPGLGVRQRALPAAEEVHNNCTAALALQQGQVVQQLQEDEGGAVGRQVHLAVDAQLAISTAVQPDPRGPVGHGPQQSDMSSREADVGHLFRQPRPEIEARPEAHRVPAAQPVALQCPDAVVLVVVLHKAAGPNSRLAQAAAVPRPQLAGENPGHVEQPHKQRTSWRLVPAGRRCDDSEESLGCPEVGHQPHTLAFEDVEAGEPGGHHVGPRLRGGREGLRAASAEEEAEGVWAQGHDVLHNR
mmetsp:Transcript_62557/g.183430  ORF Transcript_62557/g.183430 Transcript_62557/m.183430 type:complete len:388 (+) Transcript_62557:494-1657(+)